MARKNLPSKHLTGNLAEAENTLADVRDGLGRIRAIAELLSVADHDNQLELEETTRPAASAIQEEAQRLTGLLTAVLNDLELVSESLRSSAPALEVVRD